MGIFDTYGNQQMKMGEPWQRHFNVGDNVGESCVPDGVYIDMEEADAKAVVIKDSIFIAELELFDYWGERVSPKLTQQPTNLNESEM